MGIWDIYALNSVQISLTTLSIQIFSCLVMSMLDEQMLMINWGGSAQNSCQLLLTLVYSTPKLRKPTGYLCWIGSDVWITSGSKHPLQGGAPVRER